MKNFVDNSLYTILYLIMKLMNKIDEKEEQTHERYVVPSLERALQIIETMAQEPKSFGVTEISKILGFPNNNVFRILKTLVLHNYVTEKNRQYRLSSKFLALGYSNLGEVNLVEKSIDIMRELRNEAKETVLLGTIIDTDGVVLEQVLGSYEIKFSIDVGHKFLLHTAAPGKAMLAYTPDEELNRILDTMKYERFNKRTIKNKSEMMKCLSDVREKGYAVDIAERIEGLHGVACPIINYLKYPVASIWITGPSERMPNKELEKLGSIVKHYALKISQRLGYES